MVCKTISHTLYWRITIKTNILALSHFHTFFFFFFWSLNWSSVTRKRKAKGELIKRWHELQTLSLLHTLPYFLQGVCVCNTWSSRMLDWHQSVQAPNSICKGTISETFNNILKLTGLPVKTGKLYNWPNPLVLCMKKLWPNKEEKAAKLRLEVDCWLLLGPAGPVLVPASLVFSSLGWKGTQWHGAWSYRLPWAEGQRQAGFFFHAFGERKACYPVFTCSGVPTPPELTLPN